jgi:hypothetical protein
VSCSRQQFIARAYILHNIIIQSRVICVNTVAQVGDMTTSQSTLDSSIVVTPPDYLKSSFASPRSRSKIKSISSFSDTPEDSLAETLEQRYLHKRRINERILHNPNQPRDVQMKAIIMKSQSPYSSLQKEEGRRIIDHKKEEERERALQQAQVNAIESGTSTFDNNSSTRLNMETVHQLGDSSAELKKLNSADLQLLDSVDSRLQSDDLQDSNRGDMIHSASDKVDSKASKKIEWLANYMNHLEKSGPLDSPDLIKLKEISDKLNMKFIKGSNEQTGKGTDVEHASEESTKTLHEPVPDPNSAQCEVDSEMENLKKQLTDANREIDKLRLERSLVHAKQEIKKLKTEIRYGRESENEDNNIDNIFGGQSASPSMSGSALVATAAPSSLPALSPITPASSGANTATTTVTAAETATATATADAPVLTRRQTKRLTARANKMRLQGLAQGGGASKWTSVAKTLSTSGAEALLEEDEMEAYREEKRRKKKKKKFMEDIEECMPNLVSNKKEVNPLILKQIQSFEFLNFLDSLDGLDGNTPEIAGV